MGWSLYRRRRWQPVGETPPEGTELLREAGLHLGSPQITLWSDRFVVKTWPRQITLRTKLIDKLISEKRWGGRCLRVVHHDQEAPEEICFHSVHPGQWFEAFEQAGIPTEDATGLRSSRAVAMKMGHAIDIVEALVGAAMFIALMIALLSKVTW